MMKNFRKQLDEKLMKNIEMISTSGLNKGIFALITPFKKLSIACALGFGMMACGDMLEVEPKLDLDKDRHYQNEFDADVAVIGIYGQLMQLAEQYVVLNELRADLMEPTMNADAELIAISSHNVRATDNNKYADPKPFYRVVLNCNDALEGLGKMREENRIGVGEYEQRISDIVAVRSWVYLQLGIHFGTVPYVTSTITSINDVNNPSLFPRLQFDALLDQLINTVEGLPYLDIYPNNIDLTFGTDGYATAKFFINKRMLLGDLNLWKGNYERAAENYKAVMETATPRGDTAGTLYYDTYRITWGTNSIHSVLYTKADDINSLVNTNNNGWRSIFARNIDGPYNYEWVWAMHFDSQFAPTYPFIRLFANEGAGEYKLRPSVAVIDAWDSQVQNNRFEFDARGRLSTKNYETAYPEVGKYTFNYNGLTAPLIQNGRWFLERAASLHLKYAEATNRGSLPGLSRLARAFVNNGVQVEYTPPGFNKNLHDATEVMNTLFYPSPYDFDAREGAFPYFRGTWYRNLGIRTRANLPAVVLPEDVTGEEEVIWTEDLILQEGALELAFEGHRWQQLLRIAMRRDPAILADRVYEKLSKSSNPIERSRASEVRTKLLAGDWFLPYNWDTN
ncbi:RagB/SusD family nutrient uptake outer membrane protein [Belliella marina]|uniref:RagB/SusD family nutrient uptake outer membrane protein n=1 Tax=Belliella marina TaxID=1644146 RepID=A0ABW4VQN8_9BACT